MRKKNAPDNPAREKEGKGANEQWGTISHPRSHLRSLSGHTNRGKTEKGERRGKKPQSTQKLPFQINTTFQINA